VARARDRTLSLIFQSKGLPARDVAYKLGIDVNTAEHRLMRYTQLGYLNRTKAGRERPIYHYRITPKGRSVLGYKPFWSRLKFWRKGGEDGKN